MIFCIEKVFFDPTSKKFYTFLASMGQPLTDSFKVFV